jgi:hypothetical protein
MTTPITRLQQYHAGYPGVPALPPGAYPAPQAPGFGQDQVAATLTALRARIAELQQRITAATQPQPAYAPQPAYPAYPQPAYPTYPQPPQQPYPAYPQPAHPTYPQPPQQTQPAYPQPAYPTYPQPPLQPYPAYPQPAYPGTTGIASVMQEMADNMQRSQWETEVRTRQLQQSMGQVSGQMANAVNQLGYSIQSIAQSFQGLFGRR